jgi:4-alpha-glucanotransferase
MERSAGILLHPTSLPSPFGIGDLGTAAHEWLSLLHKHGVGIWQILPLGPTGYGNSPYQCLSTYAGNTLLISPELLEHDGLLTAQEVKKYPKLPETRVDYDAVASAKDQLFRIAFTRFVETEEYVRFCKEEQDWLADYVLFVVLKKRFNGLPWNQWDALFIARNAGALAQAELDYAQELRYQTFLQFQFFKQWQKLHDYARKLGIAIMGDIPIYVAFDSADVWAHPEYFELDAGFHAIRVAGVPPDYFSAGGQLWGNPLYRWDVLKTTGYSWWITRIRKALALTDYVRLDHFRGFESYWAVPAQDTDARAGTWVHGPGIDLFMVLQHTVGIQCLIAEDLGDINDKVIRLKEEIGLPGMNVLQFAFDGNKQNGYLPHNVVPDSVIYTGTHDNNTTRGWFSSLLREHKERVLEYLNCNEKTMTESMVRAACASSARYCIVPLQDILDLDSRHRMNTPGTVGNNWEWRCTESMLKGGKNKLDAFSRMIVTFGRNRQ